MTPKIFNSIARYLADHPKLTIFGMILYCVIPIDVVPEVLLGPLGYLDDLLVVVFGLWIRQYGQNLKKKSPSDIIDTTASED